MGKGITMPLKTAVLLMAASWILLAPTLTHGQTMTARDYYNELHDAKGLDNFADQYVCFDNDPSGESFFIFAQSSILRDFLKANGDRKSTRLNSSHRCISYAV